LVVRLDSPIPLIPARIQGELIMASGSVLDRFITPLLVCLCVLAAGVGINADTLPAGFQKHR